MNAAVNHIMQIVDWKRFTLEEWLYQFGAWMSSVSGTCGRSVNPIAVAMDQAVVKSKGKKIAIYTDEIIAGYFCGDIEPLSKLNSSKHTCQITDNEARAVQRLILDMQGQSEVLDGWLDAVIDRYFYNNSWSEMVKKEINPEGDEVIVRTGMDAKFDVKCGLAALHCRYNFIDWERVDLDQGEC